ncbi:MAG: hypothetical protein HYV95_17355 [Opitutae bacterium]|nr:hypothetical protein [Opitutae bacterium]
MKTIRLLLGLLASLFLFVGLTKAAQTVDPLHAQLKDQSTLTQGTARDCSFSDTGPCKWL